MINRDAVLTSHYLDAISSVAPNAKGIYFPRLLYIFLSPILILLSCTSLSSAPSADSPLDSATALVSSRRPRYWQAHYYRSPYPGSGKEAGRPCLAEVEGIPGSSVEAAGTRGAAFQVEEVGNCQRSQWEVEVGDRLSSSILPTWRNLEDCSDPCRVVAVRYLRQEDRMVKVVEVPPLPYLGSWAVHLCRIVVTAIRVCLGTRVVSAASFGRQALPSRLPSPAPLLLDAGFALCVGPTSLELLRLTRRCGSGH